MSAHADPPGEIAARLRGGDPRALARAITLVEARDPAGAEIVRAVVEATGAAATVGFTGPPGAGKSTLLAALTRRLRADGRRVGLLSVDPSSPFTGGAVLGDRVRMSDHFVDEDVFIRSMATRGALGGLSAAALQTAILIEAAGFDPVLVETAGVGQVEIDVRHHVDTVVLVLMPGAGDAVQAMKAGVMEIPDVIVVNKADYPATADLVRALRSTRLSQRRDDGWRIPIVKTDAREESGLDDLAAALAAHRDHLLAGEGLDRQRRRNAADQVVRLAGRLVVDELQAAIERGAANELLETVAQRREDPVTAARALLRSAAQSGNQPPSTSTTSPVM